MTHSHTHTHSTPTQILIFTANVHPFHNLSQLFLHPLPHRRLQRVSAVLVSTETDYKCFSILAATHHLVAPSSPISQSLESYPAPVLCTFTVDQSFTLSDCDLRNIIHHLPVFRLFYLIFFFSSRSILFGFELGLIFTTEFFQDILTP